MYKRPAKLCTADKMNLIFGRAMQPDIAGIQIMPAYQLKSKRGYPDVKNRHASTYRVKEIDTLNFFLQTIQNLPVYTSCCDLIYCSQIEKLCEACPTYGKKWSCPPCGPSEDGVCPDQGGQYHHEIQDGPAHALPGGSLLQMGFSSDFRQN